MVLYAFIGLQWIFPYLAYFWTAASRGPLVGLEAAAAAFVAIPPVMLVLSIGLKWTIIGRIKPGDYPLWGAYYFRWWLTRRILDAAPTHYLAGTPLINLYFRLLGARIGREVFLALEDIDAADVIGIADGAMISEGAVLSTTCVERGLLRIGSVDIGPGAFVGNMAVVERNASIGEDAALDDLSALPRGGDSRRRTLDRLAGASAAASMTHGPIRPRRRPLRRLAGHARPAGRRPSCCRWRRSCRSRRA